MSFPLLLLAACGDLLPGERVLGEEVPAVVLTGSPGSRLGAGVAVGALDGQPVVGIAAPDAGTVRLVEPDGSTRWEVVGEPGLGRGLTIVGDRVLALAPGEGVVALSAEGNALVTAAPDAQQLALCPDGRALTSPEAAAAVACGPEGQELRTTCGEEACRVLLDGVLLDETSPGADVGFWGEVACWGDPDLPEDDAPGQVRCADGTVVEGLVGEHLGRTIDDGWIAGVFDKWIVPARARVRPLGGGEVWAVDRAAEATRIAVAASEELVVVGVPGYAGREPGEGRVYIVDLAAADP